MKHIAHTINRSGEVVPANGFKQPTPTTAIHNHGIWGHSIERTDHVNPIKGILVFIGFVVAAGIVMVFVR